MEKKRTRSRLTKTSKAQLGVIDGHSIRASDRLAVIGDEKFVIKNSRNTVGYFSKTEVVERALIDLQNEGIDMELARGIWNHMCLWQREAMEKKQYLAYIWDDFGTFKFRVARGGEANMIDCNRALSIAVVMHRIGNSLGSLAFCGDSLLLRGGYSLGYQTQRAARLNTINYIRSHNPKELYDLLPMFCEEEQKLFLKVIHFITKNKVKNGNSNKIEDWLYFEPRLVVIDYKWLTLISGLLHFKKTGKWLTEKQREVLESEQTQ